MKADVPITHACAEKTWSYENASLKGIEDTRTEDSFFLSRQLPLKLPLIIGS